MGATVEPVAENAPIEISLLDRFAVRVRGLPIDLPTRKTRALLAYLALSAGSPRSREKVQALLWPESGKFQAQASLRQALLTLRKALSPHSHCAVQANGTTIALDASQVRVDVAFVERRIADGTRESLEYLLSVAAGPLLDGFAASEPAFDEWIDFERARLQEKIVGALEKLAGLQAEAGRVDRAIETALRSWRLDPLRERTHRTLMRLYATDGRRAAAVQQYEACVATLRRKLGVEPEEETTRLHRDILREPGSKELTARAPAATISRAPIVGRERELRRLNQALDEAWAGSGHLVVLHGDAGVGKTRLVEAATASAIERGAFAMRARCFETEQVIPLTLWVDLLRSEPSHSERALGALAPVQCAEIARILTPHGGHLAPLPRTLDDVRPLFEAVGALLARIADRAPLLVVLEDLHWADAMSLRLLSFMARRTWRPSCVCLVATVRGEEMGETTLLQTVLREIDREQRLSELCLGPLSRENTLALMRGLAPDPEISDETVLEQVWAISEGNPLVVAETARELMVRGIAPGAAGLSVPLRVRELVAGHVARLDRFSQEVLTIAAAIGRSFDFALLLHASGSTECALARAVEDLVRARLVQATSDGFHFTHARIREVVYESLLPERKGALHHSIARALEELCANRLDPMAETSSVCVGGVHDDGIQ